MSYDNLTDGELDKLIQERFCPPFPADRCCVCGWTLDPEGIMCTPTSCSLRPAPERRADAPAHYSSDDRDARSLRDRMAEMNLVGTFMRQLASVLMTTGTHSMQGFKLLNCTPRQQCIAALKALEASR